jgi:hypothetical protein
MVNNMENISKELRDSQIIDFCILSNDLSIKINFFIEDNKELIIHFIDVLVFNYSKLIEERDSCFYVNECEIEIIKNGGKEKFKEFKYPFRNIHNDELINYKDHDLFYFNIEGDVCLSILCGLMKVFYKTDNLIKS